MPTNPSGPSAYGGGAFDPTLPKGRGSGQVQIRANESCLHFQNEHAEFALPLDGLQAKPGGAAGRLFFFTHARHPERTIHTAAPEILKDPELLNRPELAAQLGKLRRKRGGRKLGLVAVAVGICALLFGLTLLKDPLVGAIAERVPVEWEERLGDLAFTQVASGGRLLEDEAVLADLEKITAPLVEAVSATSGREYNYEFFIVRDPVLNAFAVPGGKVALHSGLILAAERPEELAGVIAHEIAHVTRQHSMKQLISTLGVYLLAQAFLGDMQGIMAILLENGSYLLTLQFSRDHESDADEVGLRYLRAANIDPRGMVEMFQKLQAAQENTEHSDSDESATGLEDLEMPDFLATHPDTAERIEAMEKLLAESESNNSAYHRFPINFRNFQRKVAQNL